MPTLAHAQDVEGVSLEAVENPVENAVDSQDKRGIFPNQSDEVLTEEGWETRSKSTSSGSTKDGLLAILVSPIWRGFGHWRTNDDKSHYKLLGMEGAGLLMIGSALLISRFSNDSRYLSPLWKSLFHLGVSVSAASYLMDLIGTFNGNSPLHQNTADPFGLSLELSLRYEPSSEFNLGAQLDLMYRNDRFWVNPYAYLDAIHLSNWNAGLDLGVAFWRGEHTRTYLSVAVDAKFQDYREDDYYLIKIIPYIEFSLDLGSWFDHLANIRFINRIGAGVELYQFKSAPSAFKDLETILVLESELNFNILEDFNFSFIYRQRPDYAIGTVTAPSKITNIVPVPGVGIFTLNFNFRARKAWYTNLEFNLGHSLDIYLSVMYLF